MMTDYRFDNDKISWLFKKYWNEIKGRMQGDFKGYWSVTVKENWRIIFKFDGKTVMDIDYIDYH